MIEIPLKKRHDEIQKHYENVYIKEYRDRVLVELLATIADRLTDIADELREQKDGK